MSKIGRIGKEFVIEIEDEIYKPSDIKEMNLEQIHMMCSFCESEGHLRFIQKHTDIEMAEIYIDNLLMKL